MAPGVRNSKLRLCCLGKSKKNFLTWEEETIFSSPGEARIIQLGWELLRYFPQSPFSCPKHLWPPSEAQNPYLKSLGYLRRWGLSWAWLLFLESPSPPLPSRPHFLVDNHNKYWVLYWTYGLVQKNWKKYGYEMLSHLKRWEIRGNCWVPHVSSWGNVHGKMCNGLIKWKFIGDKSGATYLPLMLRREKALICW